MNELKIPTTKLSWAARCLQQRWSHLAAPPLYAGQQPSEKPWILGHAASGGDVKALVQFLAEVREMYCVETYLTTITQTGWNEARSNVARGELDGARTAPLFDRAEWRRWMASPPLWAVVERQELWPCLMAELTGRGVGCWVHNGRLGRRSARLYRTLRFLGVWRAETLRGGFCLSAQDRAQFQHLQRRAWDDLGVRISSKWLHNAPRLEHGPSPYLDPSIQRKDVLIAGSVRPREVQTLLSGVQGRSLVLAPRYPARDSNPCALLCERAGFRVQRATDIQRGQSPLRRGDILILDTFGDLATMYTHGSWAYVGGTLFSGGGHSPVEALRAGCGLVIGPYRDEINWMLEGVSQEACVRRSSAEIYASLRGETGFWPPVGRIPNREEARDVVARNAVRTKALTQIGIQKIFNTLPKHSSHILRKSKGRSVGEDGKGKEHDCVGVDMGVDSNRAE